MPPFDITSAKPVKRFDSSAVAPVHEGMTHGVEQPIPYPAIEEWRKGVEYRTKHPLESIAQAATDIVNLPPVELAMQFGGAGATAYHGSPHVFEAFDLAKIGTGEGAQAYGHGLYLAEHPDVAKSYQTALAKAKYNTLTEQEQQAIHPQTAALHQEALTNGVDSAKKLLDGQISNLSQIYKYEPTAENKNALGALRKLRENGEFAPTLQSNLYKTDIPDAHIDKMLDWDKPLSEQSQHVQDALANSKNKHIQNMLNYANTPYSDPSISGDIKTMGEAFKMLNLNLSSKATADSVKASQLLAKEGIPGIKYLDGSSRTAGEGTRNFVMFDPEHIRILERNNVPTGQVPFVENVKATQLTGRNFDPSTAKPVPAPDAAITHLKENPHLEGDFKAKYGYLP